MMASPNGSSRSSRSRQLVIRGICLFTAVLSLSMAALAVRSRTTHDGLSLVARYNGNAFHGSGWETWIYSQRGELRLNLNRVAWHYVANPNPMQANQGLHLYSTEPVNAFDGPVPTAATAVLMATGRRDKTSFSAWATGFDAFGFGAGRVTSSSATGRDWSVHSHSAIRVPLWSIAIVLFLPTVILLCAMTRQRKVSFPIITDRDFKSLGDSTSRCPLTV